MTEFEVIERYFSRPAPSAILGVGDDAALLQPNKGMCLVVSSDLLVEGQHFFSDVLPQDLGHKALAVNLSDLAAMGATPRWFLLSLALPSIDSAWLSAFAAGLLVLADQVGIELVGGDTTRGGGVLINITVLGEVPTGKALRRDGAQAGDDIWVSGVLGSAALGLSYLKRKLDLPTDQAVEVLSAFHRPSPRIDLGLALRGVAHRAIDVSDGLLADLGHIAQASGLGATLVLPQIPCALSVAERLQQPLGMRCLLSGGEDYELCFTASPRQRAAIGRLSQRLQLPLSRIGTMTEDPGLRLDDGGGRCLEVDAAGFDHFGEEA